MVKTIPPIRTKRNTSHPTERKEDHDMWRHPAPGLGQVQQILYHTSFAHTNAYLSDGQLLNVLYIVGRSIVHHKYKYYKVAGH